MTMRSLSPALRALAIALTLPAIVSCGGGSDPGNAPTPQGRIIFRVTDEPLDTVSSVHLQFSAIKFSRKDGQEFTRSLDSPKLVDVLALREGRTAVIADWEVPPGEYVSMQPIVDAKPNVRDSYVTLLTGEECELVDLEPERWSASMPKQPVSTDPAKPTSLVLHVDLFASVQRVDCAQGVQFAPRVDLQDEARSGWIEGYVDYDRSSPCKPKVYVWYYDLPDYAVGVPHDTPDMSPSVRPLTVTGVHDREGRGYYRTPLLAPRNPSPATTPYDPLCPYQGNLRPQCPPPGEYYTLSFTCDDDDPTKQEALLFVVEGAGAVVEGRATRVDLVAP